jgi:hypothetical protein
MVVLVSNLVAALTLTASVMGLGWDVGGYSKPDSKVARNVLEGKAEGYCSVSVQLCPMRPLPYLSLLISNYYPFYHLPP